MNLDQDARVCSPTVLGAIRMTWKLAFPVARIRRSAHRRKHRRILEDLGVAEETG